jgi:hypothetical protein
MSKYIIEHIGEGVFNKHSLRVSGIKIATVIRKQICYQKEEENFYCSIDASGRRNYVVLVHYVYSCAGTGGRDSEIGACVFEIYFLVDY